MIPAQRTLKYAFVVAAILYLTPLISDVACATGIIRHEQVVVEFDEPLAGAAKEVARIYPDIKGALEGTFTWRVDFIPVIRLVRNSEDFRSVVGNGPFVALAMPARDLIVIDYSRMKHLLTLDTTLRHEMCHLMLHRNIPTAGLPRWLDEGVCQWVSAGMSELMIDAGKTDLEGAMLAEQLLPLSQLSTTFPADASSLSLVYQQSRSVIDYIDNEFGSSRLLTLLEYLREGVSLEEASQRSLSLSVVELERKWHDHLKKRITWITYVSNNVHEILFLLGGALTIFGFVRIMRRRRAYVDKDGEDTAEEHGAARSLRELEGSENDDGKKG
jgi:hypothetical protein